jgi:sugar/nucleoside kinase (ribokinase family)/fructoselysine-6-P-deglycase FrlB-like protein
MNIDNQSGGWLTFDPADSSTVQDDSEKGPQYLASINGGSVGNTLTALAILGNHTSVLSAIGDDAYGKRLIRDLNEFGVTTSLLRTKKGGRTRRFSHIIYQDRKIDHAFLGICPWCNTKFGKGATLNPNDMESLDIIEAITTADILHIDRPSRYNMKLVEKAAANTKIISFDFGYASFFDSSRIDRELSAIIKHVDIFKTTSKAADTIQRQTGRNVKDYILEINPRIKVYVNTAGARGIEGFYVSDGRVIDFSLPGFRTGPILDSAGAGDAFHAGLLHKLFESGSIDDWNNKSFEGALSFAQATAFLACLYPGALGYILDAQLEGQNLSSILIQRIKEILSGRLPNGYDRASKLQTRYLRELFEKSREPLGRGCRACGSIPESISEFKKTTYESNIDHSAWPTASVFESVFHNSALKFQVRPKDLIYFVGSGASLSVANFCEYLTNDITDGLAKAMTPYEYIGMKRKSDQTVLVSYGGKGDIVSSLSKARDQNEKISIIVSETKSELAELARKCKADIFVAATEVKDSGFVSTIGMLTGMALFTALLKDHLESESKAFFVFENIRRLFESARTSASNDSTRFIEQIFGRNKKIREMHVVILGRGAAKPAMLDFEAKLTEGGICTSELAELKNYTHGRYLNAYWNKENRAFVLFGTPAEKSLVEFLQSKLGRYFPVLALESTYSDFRGTFELMIRQLYLTSYLGRQCGIDLCKPNYPAEARGLYSWGPLYKGEQKTNRLSSYETEPDSSQ